MARGAYPYYNRVRMGPRPLGLFVAFIFSMGRGSGEITGTGTTWILG